VEPLKPFRVTVCEVATGIVCKPTGVRWQSDRDGEDEQSLHFATCEEAMNFIDGFCERRSHLECHLYREGEHLGRFTRRAAYKETDEV
jgi:hypothetical protein